MSFYLIWLRGLLVNRFWRLMGTAIGVAMTVGLLASIGVFTVYSGATMTQSAIKGVPVDWQIQVAPGTDVNSVKESLSKVSNYTALQQVEFGDTAGFSANTGGTVQVTGPGKVLGLPSGYTLAFPKEIRTLQGSSDGVLVAQQTAANLHVKVGDSITVQRVGLNTVQLKVSGIVDLPNADSLFQVVGLPATAAPQAPPDNVVIVPSQMWHKVFDPQAAKSPDSVYTQLHVRLVHDFSTDPVTAYTQVQQLANNLEARIAGSGTVGNNLAAKLGGAREDALYARVVFLFLGMPGVLVAAFLTLAISASGAKRREQEQALLRVRGGSTAMVLRLTALESVVVALIGAGIGVAAAYVGTRWVIPTNAFTTSEVLWLMGAALGGVALAVCATVIPAWQRVRKMTVMSSRAIVGRAKAPLWQRLYIDLLFITLSGIAFWRTASLGYKLVLTPEGVSQTSVQYETFIAPLFLWLGGGLLVMRLCRLGLVYGRGILARLFRPFTDTLSGVIAAFFQRQSLIITRGIVLVTLAFSFAASTAVFNTTYNRQSRIDAQLTNGADVTVTGQTANAPSAQLSSLRTIPGVVDATSMMHRFAYVGHDLQDIYGIDPAHIEMATSLSNAYFGNGNAQGTLKALSSHTDGVLVSEETVRDYQLHLGDLINLRLQSASDNQYHIVPFHFIGTVREFPTAPKDSFLVANASYIAKMTGHAAAEIVLMKTSSDPAAVSARARQLVAGLPGAQVSDLNSTAQSISSNLTAVDLHGLTRLEMAFATVFIIGATGLVLALGLADRRRIFAILRAIGARKNQLGAFLWGEGILVFIGGAIFGACLGFGVALMFVKVLTGVFDPPPEFLAVPWNYLVMLAVLAVLSITTAIYVTQRALRRSEIEVLRDL